MGKYLTEIEQYTVDFVYKMRIEKGQTQGDIGFIIGTQHSFVYKCENPNLPAKYNLNHINSLADHWGISPREFLPKNPFETVGTDSIEK